MATARTWLRPMCCCTSRVTSIASRPSAAGWRMTSGVVDVGEVSANSASITGPDHLHHAAHVGAPAATVRCLGGSGCHLSVSVACSVSLFERRGAADDLGDLLRDRGLAHPVVGARKAFEHVAGVVGGVLHGRARAP